MSFTDPHGRARLTEVQDLLLVAHDADDVARAVLQLVAIFTDEWDGQSVEREELRELLGEAVDLLTNPETRVNFDDWKRAARAAVGPVSPRRRTADPDHGFLGSLAPIDPRD